MGEVLEKVAPVQVRRQGVVKGVLPHVESFQPQKEAVEVVQDRRLRVGV